MTGQGAWLAIRQPGCKAPPTLQARPFRTTAAMIRPRPAPGTVKNMYVFVETAPATGTSWTLTLRRNGADTPVTCTITGNGSLRQCSDTTHSEAYVAGDLISIRISSANGPTGTPGQWTAQFAP